MPAAIIGNSKMLAALRNNGELIRLFWPAIDYGQHLGRFWPGIKLGGREDVSSLTKWFHTSIWEAAQHYAKNTNILHTELKISAPPLSVVQTDFVLPDEDVLIRHYEITNCGEKGIEAHFYLYCTFNIEESPMYDGAYIDFASGALVFYRRDIYLAVAAPDRPLSGYHLGRRGTPSDPFSEACHGRLWGGKDNIRQSAGALAWELGTLEPGQKHCHTLYLAAAESLASARDLLRRAQKEGFQMSLEKTRSFWQGWLSSSSRGVIDEAGWHPGYHAFMRSLLVLKLLSSKESGASIAAPEFDPFYVACGGYGYCWPRDAVYTAAALDEAGFYQTAEQFYLFAASVQDEDGSWHQRYYTSGHPASTWGKQVDQTGTVLWGFYHHYRLTEDKAFLVKIWQSTQKAASYLADNIMENGLPAPSYNLWEDEHSQDTYAAAAVCAGLRAAAQIALLTGEKAEAKKWRVVSSSVRQAIFKKMWSPQLNRFVRGINRRTDAATYEGTLKAGGEGFCASDPLSLYQSYWAGTDERVDAALLGLAFPFAILKPQDEKMLATAKTIEEKLWHWGTGGIGRYEGDSYRGGNPWVLTTLWLSIYKSLTGKNDEAHRLYDWSLKQANFHFLLPEQADKNNGGPAWAMPLSWSHAMFILAHLALHKKLKCFF